MLRKESHELCLLLKECLVLRFEGLEECRVVQIQGGRILSGVTQCPF